MLERLAVACLILPFALVGPLAAQPQRPPTGPPDVLVMLEGQRLIVGPRGVAVCKNPEDCATFFTVTWIGSRGEAGKIQIQFDEGAEVCFDRTSFTIDDPGPAYRQTVNLRTDNPDCRGKTAFFYTVSCIGGTGNDCGGVAPVDPGAMVDGGG